MTTLIETMAKRMEDARANYYGVTPAADPPEERLDLMRAYVNAALTAIEAAGYRVVPVEPTERMEMAGKCELATHEMPVWGAKYIAKMAYTAMLAAAPKVTE